MPATSPTIFTPSAATQLFVCKEFDLPTDVDSDYRDISAILPKDIVVRQKHQRFRQRLRQQQPIERVAMQRRQLICFCIDWLAIIEECRNAGLR